MPTEAPNGTIVIIILCMTWCLNVLFGILIARATYRALTLSDPNQFYRMVLLNDALDRIRNAVVNEAASWVSV